MTMFNPAPPGEILKELVIESLELTITDVANHLDVIRKTLSNVLNTRGSVTPEVVVRIKLSFGKPSAEHWLRLQNAYIFGKLDSKKNLYMCPHIKVSCYTCIA